MRIGIFAYGPGVDPPLENPLGLSLSLRVRLQRIREAEVAGFGSVWIPHLLDHDALTTLALAGELTSTIELGTAVVPTYPRHPTALAQQTLTTQAATGNRLALGIGLSHRFIIENQFGLDYSKPIRHMREYLISLGELLSGRRTHFVGEEYRIRAHVQVVDAQPPPVLVAALGPQMLRLTGRLADGTITWLGGERFIADTVVPTLGEAAREAGRPAPRIIVGLPVAVTHKPDAVREAAATIFAGYALVPSYRAVLNREGAATAADVAIVGDESAVERQINRLRDLGATELMAVPFDAEADPGVRGRTYQFLGGLAKSTR
jgi:5,10-methylenetetrahydromethanopterin reductase